MKKLLVVLAVISLAFVFANTAQAALITFTDIFAGGVTVITGGGNDPYTYQHDLLLHGFTLADAPFITSATVFIDLSGPTGGGAHKVTLLFDGFGTAYTNTNVKSAPFNNGGDPIPVTFSYLSDGKLNVTLDATVGQYTINDSTLVVEVDRQPGGGGGTEIPEPMTVSLLGIGLLGLVGLRKRS